MDTLERLREPAAELDLSEKECDTIEIMRGLDESQRHRWLAIGNLMLGDADGALDAALAHISFLARRDEAPAKAAKMDTLENFARDDRGAESPHAPRLLDTTPFPGVSAALVASYRVAGSAGAEYLRRQATADTRRLAAGEEEREALEAAADGAWQVKIAADRVVGQFPAASFQDVLFKLRLVAREIGAGEERVLGSFGPSDGVPNPKPEENRRDSCGAALVAAIRDLARLSAANIGTAAARVATPGPETIAELIERWCAIDSAHNDAIEARETIEFAAREEFPIPPREICLNVSTREQGPDIRRYVASEEKINAHYDEIEQTRWASPPSNLWTGRAKCLALLAEYEAACHPILARHGFFAAIEREEMLEAEYEALIERIRIAPARTFADVLAKLSFADRFEQFVRVTLEDPDAPAVAPTIIASLLGDLERLAAGERDATTREIV